MSEREFENYLKLIGKLLQLSRGQQEQITGELRDHLQSRVSELESQGIAHQDAVGKALEEFGDAAAMAKNFQTVMKLKRRRWMMRFATLSMASVFLMVIFTMAMWPSNARFGSPIVAQAKSGDNLEGNQEKVEIDSSPELMSDATRRNLETERRLGEVVTLDYDETPWSEIEEELEKRGGFNILLDQSARDDSLTADEPLTFKLAGIPLRKAMLMMLAEKNATFHIDHGIVVVISRDDAVDPKYMKVKMFDCRDLIDKLDISEDQPLAAIAGLMGQAKGGGLAGGGDRGAGSGGRGSNRGGGGFGGGRGAPASKKARNTREELLLDLVSSMVTPDEWESTGQGLADAKIVNGVLIVKHRQAALAEIESLLKDLVYQVNTNNAGLDHGSVSERARSSRKAPARLKDEPHEEDQDPFGADEPGGDDPFVAEDVPDKVPSRP